MEQVERHPFLCLVNNRASVMTCNMNKLFGMMGIEELLKKRDVPFSRLTSLNG